LSEEYDLKKSEKGIGQLYPVLKDKNGNVIDGFHRLDDDPNWRTETLEHIDSEEKLLVARAVANWNRRQVSREEKEEWINGLARIYSEQGYKISKQIITTTGGYFVNEIVNKIAEVTGLHSSTVLSYLLGAYKQKNNLPPKSEPKIPASQRVESELGSEVKERFEEEVKQKLKEEANLSPEEKAKLEAERQQKLEEKKRKDEENKQKRKEQTQLKAIESALSKIEKAKNLGLDTSKLDEKIKQIKKHAINDPDVAYEETKTLKKALDTAINKEKKRREEEKRKQHEEEIRRQAEEEARLKLLQNKDFLNEVVKVAPKILDSITPTAPNPEELEITKNSVDRVLDKFEEVLKTIDPKKFDEDPEIMRQSAFRAFKSLMEKYSFPCPVCGNTKIVRECGHEL